MRIKSSAITFLSWFVLVVGTVAIAASGSYLSDMSVEVQIISAADKVFMTLVGFGVLQTAAWFVRFLEGMDEEDKDA